MLTDHEFPECAAFSEGSPLQNRRPRAYVAHLTATLGELRDFISELDGLVRDELRLG
jgi:hypothetical protein